MDVFNRAPSISEDTVHFTIYPPQNLSDKSSVASFAACVTETVNTLLPDFIWHRDAFEVKLVENPVNPKEWILDGRIRVGDCIDDEWLTVWILREITAKWDLAVSVYDSDGEFLLIEAADVLPPWVSPSNSENRVWIYKSRLHLIPLTFTSPSSKRKYRRRLPGQADSDNEGTDAGDEEDFIAIDDALKFLRDPLTETVAPREVEEVVWKRISRYPSAIGDHLHTTKAYIPEDIAKALSANPSLIQKAVETFYTRDAIQLRAAHKMSRFPPHTSVLTPVRMTRTAYAQLVGQKFFPPKIFGQFKEPEGSNEWRWKDVGMKIAVGFEMLYQESKGRSSFNNQSGDSVKSQAEAQKEALSRSPDYQNYIQNLESVGYFRGELKGSELWNKLEDRAAATFVNIRRADDVTRPSFTAQVDSALAGAKALPDGYAEQAEDSDAWLNVDADDFDALLEKTMAAGRADKTGTGPSDDQPMDEDAVASDQAKKLKDLASKVEDFVEGKGDLAGALFQDEKFSDDEDVSDEDEMDFKDDEDDEDSEDGETTNPNPEQENKERTEAMNKLVPGLEPGDYGKMPASFHSNSQATAPTTIVSDVVADASPSKPTAPKNEEPKTREKPIRPPIITRDRYDGVDSDDESDVEEDDESEDEKPQVVGEVEIDMGEEEEEFLEFARQQLGISDSQWAGIVDDRKSRGAFLPKSATKKPPSGQKPKVPTQPEPVPPPKQAPSAPPRQPQPGPRPNANPELDSFEAIMDALDGVLAQKRKPQPQAKAKSGAKPPAATKDKGKQKATVEDAMDVDGEDDEDIEAAMEAELKAALAGEEGDSDEEPMDYNLIKNFLESFKSQSGLAGPVGNLAGRLKPDLKMPRDES